MDTNEEKQLFRGDARVEIVKSNTPRPIKLVDLFPQIIASSLMYLPVIQVGINMSFASVLIASLADSNEIEINTNIASTISSIWSITVPLGAICSGYMCDKYGRKKIGVVISVPLFFAWILIGFAQNIQMIYAARIIAGVCSGVTTANVVYTGEISYKKIRSALLCMNSVWVSVGIFSTYLLNCLHLNWHIITWIYAALSLVSLLLIILVPESPHWILYFNHKASEDLKLAQLKKCLSWLYRDPELAASQYQELLEGYQRKKEEQVNQRQEQKFSWTDSIKKPQVYKPLGILIVIFFLQQMSGGYILIFYTINIFRNLGSEFASSVNENFASLMLGSIRLIMSIVAAVLSRKCNRKTLLFISTFGMSAFAFISAIKMWSIDGSGHSFLFKQNTNETVSSQIDQSPAENYFLLICILSYILFASLGILIIPWTCIAELYPTKYKAKYGGLTVALAYVFMSIVLKIFPFAIGLTRISVIFLVFGAASLICGIFIHFYLPETHRKTFTEIENHFLGIK